jgi:nicotinate-nucleotide pyrophosphorylase (carboxylating)
VVQAIRNAKAAGKGLRIQCEVEDLSQLELALNEGVDSVLLDNMSNAELAACVALVAGRAETEASGGMTPERIASIVDLGLERVSVGGLIHQARWVDLALEFEE